MNGKRLTGVGLLLVLVAMLAMAVSASSAGAVACTKNILCSGGGAGEKIRDDLVEPPESAGYGASALLVNTKGELRLLVKEGAKTIAENKTPLGYAFFGFKMHSNPTIPAVEPFCTAEHTFALGYVTFADFQHSGPSPVFSGESPSGHGAWPVEIRSDLCKTNPGRVTIENVHLYFPVLGATAVGTFAGVYEQPGANCAGGGVKLNKAQPEVFIATGLTAEVDNGTGGEAFICFVSSNNYLFPEKAPSWTPLTGSIWKD